MTLKSMIAAVTLDQDLNAEETQPAEDQPAVDTAADVEEISINDIGAVAIGQTENAEAGTGCTVLLVRM